MGGLMLAVTAYLWLALPGSVREQFSGAQRVTLLAIFLAMAVFLYGIARSSVRADSAGLWIVNAYKVRRLEWAQVLQVRLSPGDPWAVLDIDDGTVLKAMAIQGSDGRRARRATLELRLLVEANSRTPRDD